MLYTEFLFLPFFFFLTPNPTVELNRTQDLADVIQSGPEIRLMQGETVKDILSYNQNMWFLWILIYIYLHSLLYYC